MTLAVIAICAWSPELFGQNTAAGAAKAAKSAASDAAAAEDKASQLEKDLDKLQQDQQAAKEQQDASHKVQKLEQEISEAQKKLDISDRTEQKVVNNVTNPQGQQKLSGEEDRLRQEALGGSSVPSEPGEVRDSFDKNEKKLQDEIDRKKKELEQAKKDAAGEQPRKDDPDLSKQIADRDAEIARKQAELNAARKEAEDARRKQTAAEAEAARLKAEEDARAQEQARQAAIEQKKKELEEAEKELKRAAKALQEKQEELNRNSELAKFFAKLLRLLSQLNALLEQLTGENADPLGSLDRGAELLDEIDRLLNDPNGYWQQLKNELSFEERERLQKVINRIRAIRDALRTLQNAAPSTNQPGSRTTPVRRNISHNGHGEGALLRHPAAMLSDPAALQHYAALERAVATGDRAAVKLLASPFYMNYDFVSGDAPAEKAGAAVDLGPASQRQLVAALARHVDQTIEAFTPRVAQLQAALQAAGADPAAQAAALRPYVDPGPDDARLSGLRTGNFQNVLWHSFRDQIVAELAAQGAPRGAGSTVVKGNTRTSSGFATPTVTLTLSLDNPTAGTEPSGNAGDTPVSQEQTVLLKPDANGEFETPLPPGAVVSQLQLGGPGLSSRQQRLNTGDAARPLWQNPALDEVQRQIIESRYRASDVLLETAIAGVPQQAIAGGRPSLLVTQWVPPLAVSRSGTATQSLQAPYVEAVVSALEGALSGSDPQAAEMLRQQVTDILTGQEDPGASGRTLQTAPITIPAQDFSGDGQVDIVTGFHPAESGGTGPAIFLQPASIADSGADGAPTVQVLMVDGSDAGLTLDPLPQRVVVLMPWPEEQPVSNAALQTMQDEVQQQLTNALRDAAPAAERLDVTLSARQVDQFASRDPDSTAATRRNVMLEYEYHAANTAGEPVGIDPAALQDVLDAHPQLGGRSGAALPRDAQSADVNDTHYTATGSWGESYPDQWALRRIGFDVPAGPSAWPDEGAALSECVVAVIGSGVDWTHPELQGRMWTNIGEDPWNGVDDDHNGFVDDLFGWNFRDHSSDVLDTGGHDTHVAGVIAARTGNGYGIAGINPAARIMALKAANHLGQADAISVMHAIRYAVHNGARIINISYGGARSSPLEQQAIEYAASHGVLVIAASGNQGADTAGQAYVSSPNVLTVAGADTENVRAGFSNWGQPVDLAAPAMDVLSLRARGTDFLLYTGDNPDYTSGTAIVGRSRDLYRASGTSFAAPLVAGVASLVWSMHPELTAVEVRNRLLMSATDLDVPGFDQNTGAGLVNAVRALDDSSQSLLLPRIATVSLARRDGRTVVSITGSLESSTPSNTWLQVAFGDQPAATDWKTISTASWPAGVSTIEQSIPAAEFSRPGIWSIRVLAQDRSKVIRQARATLSTQ
jgi:subtilisin family serine protease